MLYKKTNRINKLLVLYNFPGLPTNTGGGGKERICNKPR